MSQRGQQPISAHPQVKETGAAAIIAAALWANLAWAGITVPTDVMIADTALIGLLVGGATHVQRKRRRNRAK